MLRLLRYAPLIALLGLAGLRPPPPKPRPLAFGAWYWHHPFRLSASDERALAAAGIDRLYIHGGTFTRLRTADRGFWKTLGVPSERIESLTSSASKPREGEAPAEPPVGAHTPASIRIPASLPASGEARGALRLISPQGWRSSYGHRYAVFRVQPDALPLLLAPAGAETAAALVARAALPVDVAGIQWDADVPRARLTEYARFLRAFRGTQPPGRALSITALPDWLGAPGFGEVVEAVDEAVPQFYGNRWPERGQPPPLWETASMLASLRRVSAAGKLWVGLPAYGRCVVTGPDGQTAGIRHDLEPEVLTDDPAWELVRAETRQARFASGQESPVEDTAAFRCDLPTFAGPLEAPVGTTLWFQCPRASGLAAAVRAVREASLSTVRGVCFFRIPVSGEPLGMPIAALRQATAAPRSSSASEAIATAGSPTPSTAVERVVRRATMHHDQRLVRAEEARHP